MSYTAGTLDISLVGLGLSETSASKIEATAKALTKLSHSIESINGVNFQKASSNLERFYSVFSRYTNAINFDRVANLSKASSAINKLTKSFETLSAPTSVDPSGTLITFLNRVSTATERIKPENLQVLSDFSKSISGITKINKLADIDYTKASNGFKELTVAITPFIDKVKEAEASLASLYGVLQKTGGKRTQKFLNGFGGEGGGSLPFGFGRMVTLTSTIYLARRLGRFVGDIAQSGADYAETLNLWEVSMGKNIDQATKFVNKLNEAYGVSKETLMNSQAIFKNMLGTLGDISDQQAYIISEGVTQMALDYSSLFNVTFEQAMTKFEAALAGQVRPIRTVSGFDITENTLYQLYQSLGGTKTQRQLSLTEKRLLAILAIFNQMGASGAIGDLEKTMLSFANQSRVLAESWKQLKAMIGSVITVIISNSEIIIKISGAMMALSRVFEALGESMGAFVHYQDPFVAVGDGAEGAETDVDKLNKSLKETENLLAIDKFRALTPTEDTTAQDISIDDVIAKGFAEEYTGLENIKNAATEVSKEILNMFGLLNEDGSIDMERLDELKDKFIQISGAVIGVVTAIAALSTITKVSNTAAQLQQMFSQGAPNKYLIIISLIVGALSYLYLTNEDVRKSFNELFETLKPLGATLAMMLTEIIKPIFIILQALSPIVIILANGLKVVALIVNAVLVPVVAVLDLVLTLITSIFEGLAEIGKWIIGHKDVNIGGAFGNAWKKMFSSEGLTAKTAVGFAGNLTDTFSKDVAQARQITSSMSGSISNPNIGEINTASANYSAQPSTIKNNLYVYLDGEQIYHSVTDHAAQRGYQWEATR